MTTTLRALHAFLLAAAACAGSSACSDGCSRSGAAHDVPEIRAPRVSPSAIRIDGKLDDAGWRGAPETRPFVSPDDGRSMPRSPVQASAKVAWSASDLYFAFVVGDARPTSPFARDAVDPHLWERSSAVELMIQPGDPGDNRDYYEVQVDVGGAIWDTRFDDYNAPLGGGPDPRTKTFGHQDWTSGTRRATAIHASGGNYAVEIAIPWSALSSGRTASPPRAGDTWRVNMYSFRDGQRESLAWSPILGEGNFHRASRFGRVTFVERGRR